jgi:uncharacterized protein (TIGR00251 family)
MIPRSKKMSIQVNTVIRIKLLPKSSRNQVVGREGDHFKVKVTAPPVEGRSNKALIDLLAKKLGVPKSHIEIISGKSSRLKSIRIDGLSIEEITRKMEK